MAYSAKIVLDSISEFGKRLTTMEVTFPRLVLAEFNTHRVFSRNSASSRAIPVHKQLKRVLDEPFIPEQFGINQPGMQSFKWLDGLKHEEAMEAWLTGRDRAASTAFELLLGPEQAGKIFGYNPLTGFANQEMLLQGFDDAIRLFSKEQKRENPEDTTILNVHKQLANRVLEPYMWHVVIVTATEWDNFFALRANQDAQAEIRRPAELMLEAMEASTPNLVELEGWHLPFIQPDELHLLETDLWKILHVSSARCARVSYLTHDGIRSLDADVTLYDRLVGSGHMSPLEHVATPRATPRRNERPAQDYGNFIGWMQLRKYIPNERNFALMNKG